MKTPIGFYKYIATVLLSGLLAGPQLATAALTPADTPLFLTVSVAPNIVMTLDDSGSMSSAFVPDTIAGTAGTKRFTSADFNPLYYNPKTRYVIPTRTDTVPVTYSTSFTSARRNGFDASRGTLDLSTKYRTTYYYYNDMTYSYSWAQSGTDVPAFYYVFDTTLGGCTSSINDDKCYRYVKVTNTSGPATFSDGSAADKDERQNFANWYSFYRTRALSVISGAMSAIETISDNQVRFAWESINSTPYTSCNSFASGSSCRGYTATTYDNRIRNLNSSHRTDFYNFLQRFSSDGSTPLRVAMERVGKYYSTSGVTSPYAQDPQVSDGTELSCRKNYHVMLTDGIWNENDSDLAVNYGNADSTAATLPDGTSYTAMSPYKDGNSNSLADIAFRYWSTDLRPDLTNNVTPYKVDFSGTAADQYWNPRNNPANWQHMVNFTVGLGLSSTMVDPIWGGSTYAGDYPQLVSGTKSWPATGSNASPGNVYDLWHAAIDSRGQFFSAEAPQDIGNAFKSILNSIQQANPSAAALAANSTSLQTGTLVYQARFDSSNWSGSFKAYPVQADGSIGTAYWDAATLIPPSGSRNIFTFNGSTGKTFTNCSSSLNAAQQLALNTDIYGTVDSKCSDRLAWLRGDSSKEVRNGGVYRNRLTTVLGDIVDADPAFSQSEDYGYTSLPAGAPGQSSYASYVASKSSRTPVVYVGANDGMLHAFQADVGFSNSGVELFSFIPAGVYGNLSNLTSPAYAHKYFVDGSPSVGDVYIGGTWQTLLLGGLGAGGKSIYALNVSNPGSFSAANVLWEFSDPADLGLTYSQPQFARLHDGSWAAIFGNGYNSTSGLAFLYIVNVQTGALIAKIPAGSATSNGLSTPYLYDSNGDKIIDAVYAGDLQGNMWKFDLSGSTPASWGVANSGLPLFTARNAANQVQPITAQPTVGAHPSGGALVYFGTGQYLTSTDPANTDVETFYAIWDNGLPVTTTDRSELQAQTIVSQTAQFGYNLRETSANTVDYAGGKRGWYMDLVPPLAGGGERVVSRPLLKYGRVIFVTLKPSNDQCEPGGTSWLMELDANTGARLTDSVFDFNNDGVFDASDNLASGNSASGVMSTVGITKTPVWLNGKDPSPDYKEMSGSSGGIMTLKNKGGGGGGAISVPIRVYWQQIL